MEPTTGMGREINFDASVIIGYCRNTQVKKSCISCTESEASLLALYNWVLTVSFFFRMDASSTHLSFFKDVKSRELNASKVRKTPFLGALASENGGPGSGVIASEHNGSHTLPLAVSFGKSSKGCHVLAVSDEEGYISFYNTQLNFPPLKGHSRSEVEARLNAWIAHHNAIFDICWIRDDAYILTASGDQTIRIWDVEKKASLGIMKEHKASVKSLSSHPVNSDMIVSGSRDGSVILWDMRCNSINQKGLGEPCLGPTAIIKNAHVYAPQMKRNRRTKGAVASMSITSVLYLKDEFSIASGGDIDSVVKIWDTRCLKEHVAEAHPMCPSMDKKTRAHGIACLSQDTSGVFLVASCMDNRIYLYNVIHPDKGPMESFSGHLNGSFYIKAGISPDGSHILSGSSDGNAYIWEVRKPEANLMVLKGHEGDVTAVAWCPSEVGKIATCSDDFTIRVWNTQSCPNLNTMRSPSSIRQRVTAFPASIEPRKLNMDLPARSCPKRQGKEEGTRFPSVDSPARAGPSCPKTQKQEALRFCVLDPAVQAPINRHLQEETLSFMGMDSTAPNCPESREEAQVFHGSPPHHKTIEAETPMDCKKQSVLGPFTMDEVEFQRTPEASVRSPSSVLNSPSSLKRRTIRDYFMMAA
ncbi:hypothetical protein AMTR_s00014p00252440 [Amborella trichopoda]|uniref:Uncharacterized protein n=2 Tax=Amborella trichopoda TaxID=13333 RepID=W1PPV5_AMBTC|nr:hypothetical protein AMTR_s00014p00252440 [Amborella trichopoda]